MSSNGRTPRTQSPSMQGLGPTYDFPSPARNSLGVLQQVPMLPLRSPTPRSDTIEFQTGDIYRELNIRTQILRSEITRVDAATVVLIDKAKNELGGRIDKMTIQHDRLLTMVNEIKTSLVSPTCLVSLSNSRLLAEDRHPLIHAYKTYAHVSSINNLPTCATQIKTNLSQLQAALDPEGRTSAADREAVDELKGAVADALQSVAEARVDMAASLTAVADVKAGLSDLKRANTTLQQQQERQQQLLEQKAQPPAGGSPSEAHVQALAQTRLQAAQALSQVQLTSQLQAAAAKTTEAHAKSITELQRGLAELRTAIAEGQRDDAQAHATAAAALAQARSLLQAHSALGGASAAALEEVQAQVAETRAGLALAQQQIQYLDTERARLDLESGASTQFVAAIDQRIQDLAHQLASAQQHAGRLAAHAMDTDRRMRRIEDASASGFGPVGEQVQALERRNRGLQDRVTALEAALLEGRRSQQQVETVSGRLHKIETLMRFKANTSELEKVQSALGPLLEMISSELFDALRGLEEKVDALASHRDARAAAAAAAGPSASRVQDDHDHDALSDAQELAELQADIEKLGAELLRKRQRMIQLSTGRSPIKGGHGTRNGGLGETSPMHMFSSHEFDDLSTMISTDALLERESEYAASERSTVGLGGV